MLSVARAIVLSLLAVSVMVLTFAIGYVIADNANDEPAASSQLPDRNDDTPAATTGLDFDQLNQILRILNDRYVNPDLIDNETLYQAAINGMLETLTDSGTFYVDPQTVQTSIGPGGSFEGIGATVASQEGQIVISAPIENTPAERAGIRPGDIVLEVDGESTEGWTTEKAVLKIRGPKGSNVTLRIRHSDGIEEVLTIERDEIEVQSVTTQPPGGALEDGAGTLIDDVGYIHIREFSKPTTDQFAAVLQEIIDSGKRGLVLDLRNNPGGLLSTTIEVADEFLHDGTVLTERDRDGSEKEFRARRGGIATDIRVVVLLNRFSASGSEVLAAALKENGRATIVGEKSFGKGTVNISNDLDDGGQLYVSIATWLTPDGTQIDGVGIRPDVAVQLSDEDIDLRRDVQLFKAIDILRGTDTTPASALTPVESATPGAEDTPTAGG